MRLGSFFLLTLLSVAPTALAAPRTEIGDINGAKFRIDIPENWNGSLVVYCHGYNPKPVSYDDKKLPPVLEVFVDQGFALAQSGYASGGWAIQEAMTDVEGVRRYFLNKYGPVKETYVTGHSMGGFLTMMLMETNSTAYDAGLPLCGPLAAPDWFMARGAFDGRVMFDYYFPGALPDPAHVDPSWKNKPEETNRVLALLDASPDKAQILRKQNNIKNDKDLAGTLTFITFVLQELQQRTGGNPFDNRSVIYSGTPDDNELNAGVKRYAADPKSVAYLRNYYTPTGRISKPMLAVHTTYDPLVPVTIPNMYTSLTEQAATSNLFVQQYVKHDGHCTILPGEVAKAFAELREWKSSGVRPTGGELR